jgi:hypothetical protein
MFGSNILDIAIGMVFLFLLLSLICSAANEVIQSLLKSRAANLEKGIRELVGFSGNRDAFLKEFYGHGLINSLFQGAYSEKSKTLPSYIPAGNFALALLSIKTKWAAARTELPANVASALEALETQAAGDAKKLQDNVEAWYNSAMDRVSGWYKRRTQYALVGVGFVLAILVNADCIRIAQTLANDSSIRQSLVAFAEASAKQQPAPGAAQPADVIKSNLAELNALGLPIGLHKTDLDPPMVLRHLPGWLLTALAVSLGAPFWFDLLNKFMVVRSTVKPDEKSGQEASKDPPKK